MLPTAKNVPTFAYPMLRYTPTGGSQITRRFTEAALAYNLRALAERGQHRTVSGKTETLFSRIEESVRLDLMCEPDELQQLEWMFRDHGAKGKPLEVWIDRHLGSVWGFNDSLRDQNLLPLVLNGGGTETYGDYISTLPGHRGIVLSGTQYLSVTLAQASAGTITGFDDPLAYTEGVLIVDFRPTWASAEAAQRIVVDTSLTSGNRLTLFRTSAGGTLTFRVDNTGGTKSMSGSITWSANDRVRIVSSWATDGTLKLWYAVGTGAFVELTTGAGAGSGIMSGLPTTLYVGAENDATDLALGTYDTVAIFKRAFASPHQILSDYHPLWRNYFPYAEVEPLWAPARLIPSRTIFTWPIACRLGVA